jgi:LacI family transcriptional regulator
MTIKDIAKRAGVSIATVSHVINRTRFVSDNLQKRVLRVMQEADYHPNLMAGSLRRKRTRTIGLIVPDNSNPVYAELSKAIESIMFSSDLTLIICNSEHDLEREIKYIDTLRERRVDGLIIIPASSQASHINRLPKGGLPVVVLDRPIPNLQADAVLIDHFQGIFDATEYLIKQGNDRIAYIDKAYDLPHKFARLEGFDKALRKHGIRKHKRLYTEAGVSYQDGASAMERLLKAKPKPTAVLAFDDVIAMGALRTIKDHGLAIPEEISIIGFDDMPLCSFTVPRLSTVHYPRYKMAEISCRILLERIAGSNSKQINQIVLPVDLVLRESTAVNMD